MVCVAEVCEWHLLCSTETGVQQPILEDQIFITPQEPSRSNSLVVQCKCVSLCGIPGAFSQGNTFVGRVFTILQCSVPVNGQQ